MENNSTIDRSFRKKPMYSLADKWEFAKRNPKYIGYVASQLFLSTQKPKPSRKEMDILAKADLKEFQINEHKIRYYHWKGEGETILLVHGWNGNTGNFSRLIPSLLEQGYNVFGIDLPGHGLSSGRYSNIVLSGKMVRNLVEQIGNPKVIITHSFGGAVATVAQELGVNAKKLVYISPPSKLELLRKSFSEYFNLDDYESDAMRHILERKVKRPLSSLDLERSGKNFTNSLLVIHDEEDEEIPYSMGVVVANSWNDSKLITTKGLGHKMILRSDIVREEILAFINEH
ncbi:alpha/beta hydrolase [Leptospira sp. 96542]|nr:alpha/beta hydrolase [Leptospira sp. 96542]